MSDLTTTNASAPPASSEAPAHAHPKEAEYVRIAIILAIVTAIEVGVYYFDTIPGLIVPVLLVLSALKFMLVAMFFMHLRFDSRLFSFIFSGPLLLAMAVMVAVLSMFQRVLFGG